MTERNTGEFPSVQEVELTPFFRSLPIYLEAVMQLKRKGFEVNSITFTPHDTPGADVEISGNDAPLVVDVVNFATKLKLVDNINPSQHDIADALGKTAALLANARAKRTVFDI